MSEENCIVHFQIMSVVSNKNVLTLNLMLFHILTMSTFGITLFNFTVSG